MLTHRQNNRFDSNTNSSSIHAGSGFIYILNVCLFNSNHTESFGSDQTVVLFIILKKTAISGSPGKNRCPTPPPNSGPPEDLIYWSFRHR